MPIRDRSQIAGYATFFVTTMLKDWCRLFHSLAVRDDVESILFHAVQSTEAALVGYCIMPDHVHLIAGHREGGPGVSKVMQSFKSLVSHKFFAEMRGIWVPCFDDVLLRSERVFRIKLQYIHENPVRAGLARTAINWKWSSARFWLLEEPSDVLIRSWDWIDRDQERQARAPGIHEGTYSFPQGPL